MMAESRLFSPLRIGKCNLQHRIVMAPLTRFRASDSHVPLPFVKEYYGQRASTPGTLMITEATFISPRASGYENAPGIWGSDQIAAWKEVTQAVHDKGSYIFLQLWALGRAADAGSLKNLGDYQVVSSSAIPMDEGAPTPKELSVEEIEEYVADYAQGAKNAIEAGFDGVEIHGANGYLIDQFTQDVSNKRTDKYGGSSENRSRFALEVTKAVVDAVGADRTAIRLSPFSTYQGMKMDDPIPQFSDLLQGLKKLKLAYVHVVESRVSGNTDTGGAEKVQFALDIWGKTSPVLLAGGFKPETAVQAVDEVHKDSDVAIVFGRYFVSTPDLPFRVKNSLQLTQYDRSKFYNAKAPVGYTDWPFSKEFEAAQLKA